MTNSPPRILHSACLLRPSSGQLQQMDWEQQAADETGLPWTTRMYCPSGAAEPSAVMVFDDTIEQSGKWRGLHAARSWLQLRRNYHRWLESQRDHYDAFLLRYYVHDPYQYRFVRRCPKPVFLFSHTLEVPELQMAGGRAAQMRGWLEAALGSRTLGHADGLVGVTDEVIEYQSARTSALPTHTFVYPNGVMTDTALPDDRRDCNVPELLFVANFLPWHGLDELLVSMQQNHEHFKLHVVGTVPEFTLALARKDPRVHLHGTLDHAAIKAIAAHCWVGISSLELHKKHARQAATLKAPQYLSFGLPVYGCGDVLPSQFPFYRQGHSDINDILQFARDMRTVAKVKIKQAAAPLIDKRLLLHGLHSTLAGWVTGNVRRQAEPSTTRLEPVTGPVSEKPT